jgi:hypothetical protein
MATDGERRAAARSLRDIAAHSEWVHAESIQKALGLETHPLLIDGSLYTSASVSRLADLIEPTDGFDLDTVARVCFECLEGCDEPEYTLYDTILTAITRYKHGESGLPLEMLVDRDALLALADEMESGPSGYTSRLWFIRAASRIREALGVEP